MFEIFHYDFFMNAVWAAILGSIACGIVGTFVVSKRIVSMSGSIAHCAFGGVGLGYFLGVSPLLTVLPFCLTAAIAMGLVSKKTSLAEDTVTGIFWSVCMALGILFIGLAPGYTPDLFSYLFGNILTVSPADLTAMLILDAIIFLLVVFLYKELLALSFDEEYATISGLPTLFLYLLLLALVALTVVILIRIVGIILVLALLTLPPSIAKNFTHSFRKMMFLSAFIGIFFSVLGIFLSYQFNLASGAVIILLSTAGFIVSLFLKKRSSK